MPGCSGHLRFPDSARDSRRSLSLAALPPKGWCLNDEVCGRRLAILFITSHSAMINLTPYWSEAP